MWNETSPPVTVSHDHPIGDHRSTVIPLTWDKQGTYAMTRASYSGGKTTAMGPAMDYTKSLPKLQVNNRGDDSGCQTCG